LVLDIVQPMAMLTRVGGVDLQLEGGELGGFLLLSIELVQARLEAIGEEKGHAIGLRNRMKRCLYTQLKWELEVW
jgi:hypothetical protein